MRVMIAMLKEETEVLDGRFSGFSLISASAVPIMHREN